MVVVMRFAIWGGGSCKNTPEGSTKTHKSWIFAYKQVIRRNGDLEWLRMTNAFILCDLLWKVQKGHTANREGSFNNVLNIIRFSYMCLLNTPLANCQPSSVNHKPILLSNIWNPIVKWNFQNKSVLITPLVEHYVIIWHQMAIPTHASIHAHHF